MRWGKSCLLSVKMTQTEISNFTFRAQNVHSAIKSMFSVPLGIECLLYKTCYKNFNDIIRYFMFMFYILCHKPACLFLNLLRAPASVHHRRPPPVRGDPDLRAEAAGAERGAAETSLHHLRRVSSPLWICEAAQDVLQTRGQSAVCFSASVQPFHISWLRYCSLKT